MFWYLAFIFQFLIVIVWVISHVSFEVFEFQLPQKKKKTNHKLRVKNFLTFLFRIYKKKTKLLSAIYFVCYWKMDLFSKSWWNRSLLYKTRSNYWNSQMIKKKTSKIIIVEQKNYIAGLKKQYQKPIDFFIHNFV